MRRILFTFPLLLIAIQLLSQSNSRISIKGKIINQILSPISFVSITMVNDPSIGVYSNTTGEFQLYITRSAKNDSLLISCIGFEDARIPLSNGSDAITLPDIVMKSKVYMLQEVIISPDTARAIVRRAVEMLETNLPSDKNILQGFFREIIRSDYTYDRLVEAAVDVFDKGYRSARDKELQFKIREIRKSDDYRDLDWKSAILNYVNPKNGLHGNFESLFYNDYIRNNNAPHSMMVGAPLGDERFYIDVIFTLDSITSDASDEILCIGIHPKVESWALLPYGVMQIRSKDLAILQMEYGVKVNSNVNIPLALPGQKYMHHTLIKYREYNGAMYLSLLYRKSFRFELNSSKLDKSKETQEGFFYHEYLFATNEIITEKDKLHRFRKKERLSKDVDLYNEAWEYNKEFWESYNAVNERPLSPRVKNDLERDRSLTEQFRKNE